MKHDITDRIIEYFSRHPGRKLKTKELARALHLPKQGREYQNLKDALRTLQERGDILRLDGRKWAVPRIEKEIVGRISIHERGFGEVAIEENVSIRIPAGAVNGAIDGDLVRVRSYQDRKGRTVGEVEEILERKPKRIVGKIARYRGSFVLEPDGKGREPFVHIPSKQLRGAAEGDKVIAEMNVTDGDISASVIEVLGRHGDERVEMEALVHRYGFALDFPDDVLNEARALQESIPASEISRRRDLRNDIVFTIDPEDAKDFDDAVSIDVDEEGNYLLGVHIADVSHYVRPGSALDNEALKRGTSVYLVNGVIPMLPEHLSNHVCSLEEGKDRLTYSAFMRITPRGRVVEHAFEKSVIRSKRRFTYEEAEEIIKTGKGDMSELLRVMHRASQMLMRKRFRDGGIDFNVPEVRIKLDEERRPVEIIPKPRLDSMRLIEEFMLLANRTVAEFMNRQTTEHVVVPFLYRVHDLPDPEKVEELMEFLRHLGLSITLDATSSKSFQRMLEALADRPEAPVVQDVTIRSMAKAVYSAKNIGHFGLGFHHYTHFTSPIRRYPDLIVHRLLFDIQQGKQSRYPMQALTDIARMNSASERNAIDAERESIKVKEIEYMKRHVGDEFDAVISGVAAFGLFVELIPTLVEGLVHVRSLTDDYYEYDARKKSLIGQRRRKKYRLGDKVRVRVVRADAGDRQLDFILAS